MSQEAERNSATGDSPPENASEPHAASAAGLSSADNPPIAGNGEISADTAGAPSLPPPGGSNTPGTLASAGPGEAVAGTNGEPRPAPSTEQPPVHPNGLAPAVPDVPMQAAIVQRRRKSLSRGIATAFILLLAILAVGFMDWGTFDLQEPGNGWWWGALSLVLLVLVGLLIAFLIVGSLPPGETGSFGASLLGQSPVMLGLAAMLTVGLYILPLNYVWWERWGHHAALLVGIASAFAFGLVVALFKRDLTAPNNVNPRIYGELQSLFYDLDAQVNSYCPLPSQGASGPPPFVADDPASDAARYAACAVARRHRDVIAQELGLPTGVLPPSTGARWVLGTGYLDIWNRLHAAEEALFLVQPEVEVAGHGLHDEMRLKDSNINNSVDYIDRLRGAVALFGALRYLSSPPPLPQVAATDITPQNKTQARVVLREVRQVINEYRDARREGLVRTRNNLLWTGTVTGMGGFLLLALAILRGVSDSAVVAATVFYLVGATVGLFNQLSSGWGDAGATEEDYGLTQARLMYTPLLSGLAAIGGVLVTTMLYATLSGPIVTTPEPTNSGQGSSTVETVEAEPSTVNLSVPQVEDIFDLGEGRFGLVIAAVFGLTPGLLVDRLKSEGERYKADLQSSNAQGNK